MAELRTEEEQLQALKEWWKENGKALILGVTAAVAIVLGWRAWQNYEEQKAANASALYQNLTQAVQLTAAGGNEAQYVTAGHLSEQLRQEYGKTAYARYGALMMAAAAVNNQTLDRALEELNWVIDNAPEMDDLVRVATLRKAMVLGQKGELQAAIDLLNGADAGNYAVQYQELLGDLYVNSNRPAEAFAAYERALELAGGELRPLLKMKRDDLAGAES